MLLLKIALPKFFEKGTPQYESHFQLKIEL
jgi:hypothetical protein